MILLGMIIGVAILCWMLINPERRHLVRIEWDKVSYFLSFMALVTFIRIAGFDWISRSDSNFLSEISTGLIDIPIYQFALVFWEDCFFAIPIYYIMKYGDCKWMKFIAVAGLSMLFGAGHAYQGLSAVAITTMVPYFILYRYGKKYGFGTTMVCHTLYDFITFYTVYFMSYLIPLH